VTSTALSTATGAPAESVQAALAEIWKRSLPTVLTRVETIELAIAELSRTPASTERVDAGLCEAHKLAGVLGTFGLDRGTDLARDLERHLAGPAASDETLRLERVAADLRATVELAKA
jgi:chemotaxis protein histidine kinase CheA